MSSYWFNKKTLVERTIVNIKEWKPVLVNVDKTFCAFIALISGLFQNKRNLMSFFLLCSSSQFIIRLLVSKKKKEGIRTIEFSRNTQSWQWWNFVLLKSFRYSCHSPQF